MNVLVAKPELGGTSVLPEAVAVGFPRLGEVDTAVQTSLDRRNKMSSGLCVMQRNFI